MADFGVVMMGENGVFGDDAGRCFVVGFDG
jgi:hypothetical protein